jgi:hypothetical protein
VTGNKSYPNRFKHTPCYDSMGFRASHL